MKLPFAIPSETFYGALTYLGLPAIIYAFLVPTDLYDSYKKLYRDVEVEQAVLAVDQRYLQQERQRLGDRVSTEVAKQLIGQEKELAIREAKREINQRRVADLRKTGDAGEIDLGAAKRLHVRQRRVPQSSICSAAGSAYLRN